MSKKYWLVFSIGIAFVIVIIARIEWIFGKVRYYINVSEPTAELFTMIGIIVFVVVSAFLQKNIRVMVFYLLAVAMVFIIGAMIIMVDTTIVMTDTLRIMRGY